MVVVNLLQVEVSHVPEEEKVKKKKLILMSDLDDI